MKIYVRSYVGYDKILERHLMQVQCVNFSSAVSDALNRICIKIPNLPAPLFFAFLANPPLQKDPH